MLFFFNSSISIAALPDTKGAAILVPPNKVNASSMSLVSSFRLSSLTILAGVNPYAPILIKSGFGSPIMPGPRLEKSITSL